MSDSQHPTPKSPPPQPSGQQPAMQRSTSSYFLEGISAGIGGTVKSIANAFNPANYSHAKRQGTQLFNAATHPIRTVNTLSDVAHGEHKEVDVPKTASRTAGDMLGSAGLLFGAAMLGTMVLKRPYLKTRFGAELTRRYTMTPLLQHPLPQHQKVREFVVTRPLALTVGGVVGTAAFIGGSQERAETAQQNAVDHPQISAGLKKGGLDEILATPVSRVVNGRIV